MFTRLETTLHAHIDDANQRWGLLVPGQSVVVGVSGGKDSLGLLHLLAGQGYDVHAVHVQLAGPLDADTAEWIRQRAPLQEIPASLLKQVEGQKNPCFACSRLRRRALLEAARDLGASVVALGHHREDVVHTLLLNMLYSRELSTMTPKQALFEGQYHLVRPLYLAPEGLLTSLQREQNIPTASLACPHDGHTRRARVAQLLHTLQGEHPSIDLTDNLFAALFRRNEDFLP